MPVRLALLEFCKAFRKGAGTGHYHLPGFTVGQNRALAVIRAPRSAIIKDLDGDMWTGNDRWLDRMLERNEAFRHGADPGKLPVVRTPGSTALLTCIDPRVNLDALGVLPFGPAGEGRSNVRIMRTIGAIAEERSLIIGIHLAGIRELAVVMHTDCGNSLAKRRIDGIIEGLQRTMDKEQFEALKARIGEPWPEGLVRFLKAFDDPRDAVMAEVAGIKARPFVPADMVVHGLVYNLETGGLELVVNGYR